MSAPAHSLMSPPAINPKRLRVDFPLLNEAPLAQGLHYLDNAATTHKPQVVIDSISDGYARYYSPIHRGLYPLAEQATSLYEQARRSLSDFLGASTSGELIFTRSATEAINLVATGWAAQRLQPGDCIWVSRMEHHANYLPWQRICQQQGAELKIIELDADGQLDFAACPEIFDPRTKLIALCHVSNVLGIENPLSEICKKAREHDIPVLVDAAQSVSHMPIDVSEIGCDFLACSAHKMYGPAGIGLLYARMERLPQMQPLLLGGGMVDDVGEGTAPSHWVEGPSRFEAGSPDLPSALGFAAAADYLQKMDRHRVHQHLQHLSELAIDGLSQIPGLQLLPGVDLTPGGIVSFTVDGVHPHDVAQVAGEYGVAIRAGHHCAQPLMRSLGVAASARASFALYNDEDDIAALVEAIDRARHLFSWE